MSATTEARLTSVQAAIAAIEGGAQYYTYEGRQMGRADLKTLYAQEKFLENKLARENRGSRGPRVTGISIRHG